MYINPNKIKWSEIHRVENVSSGYITTSSLKELLPEFAASPHPAPKPLALGSAPASSEKAPTQTIKQAETQTSSPSISQIPGPVQQTRTPPPPVSQIPNPVQPFKTPSVPVVQAKGKRAATQTVSITPKPQVSQPPGPKTAALVAAKPMKAVRAKPSTASTQSKLLPAPTKIVNPASAPKTRQAQAPVASSSAPIMSAWHAKPNDVPRPPEKTNSLKTMLGVKRPAPIQAAAGIYKPDHEVRPILESTPKKKRKS